MGLHLKYPTCFPSVLIESRREKLIPQNKAVTQENRREFKTLHHSCWNPVQKLREAKDRQ